MTVEEIIISFVRIFASLIVFKFNFYGGLLVILIDFSDLFYDESNFFRRSKELSNTG